MKGLTLPKKEMADVETTIRKSVTHYVRLVPQTTGHLMIVVYGSGYAHHFVTRKEAEKIVNFIQGWLKEEA